MTSGQSVLFVSHVKALCGVYDFGHNVTDALQASRKYRFPFVECSSAAELNAAIETHRPAAVIYNYHPSTMPWLRHAMLVRHRIPHIGILHEVTQQVADAASNELFDFYIAPDPTLLLRNPIVFKTGRLIAKYENAFPVPAVATIGSFGFGTPGKGFERLVETVQRDFDRAVVRLSIPYSTFADADGNEARAIANRCRALLTKPGIDLQVQHDFLPAEGILDFLAQNSLNAFFYEQQTTRGISSAVDYAMAVGRPLAITKSSMFRHLLRVEPSIAIEDSSLRDIMGHGFAPLVPLRQEWTAETTVWEYERIIGAILAARQGEGSRVPRALLELSEGSPPAVRAAAARLGETIDAAAVSVLPLLRRARNKIAETGPGGRLVEALQSTEAFSVVRKASRRVRGPQPAPAAVPDWVPRYKVEDDALKEKGRGVAKPYAPIPSVRELNRILDKSAFDVYRPAIDYLFEQMPEKMARKIPQANIQQAFVLDTVVRLAKTFQSPRLLCVGSYEDTASEAVSMSGLRVDEVDPVINYDLSTFLAKPSTKRGGYHVVFATSVIEHVTDDETFVKDMEALLAPGGLGVLTCDFNDTYKPGDRLPIEDRRFYTKRDLAVRFPSLLVNSELVDRPNWDCDEPDFFYGGCQYTFATFVFRRVR